MTSHGLIYTHSQTPPRRNEMTSFNRNDIATLAASEGISEMALITQLQHGAVISGDEDALEALCNIKAEILGL